MYCIIENAEKTMNLSKTSDILKSKVLTPVIFAGIGARKTYKDYKESPSASRSYVITKDAAILGSAALGYAAGCFALKKMPNIAFVDSSAKFFSKQLEKLSKKRFVKEKLAPIARPFVKPMNIMHTSLNYIETAAKECTSGCFVMAVTVLSSIAGNRILSNYLFKNKEKDLKSEIKAKNLERVPQKLENIQPQECEKAKQAFKDFKSPNYYLHYVNTEFTKNPANKIFASFSFLPVMRALDLPLTAATGFDISKEENIKKQISKTSTSMIAYTVVPTFFVSIASSLTKNLKNCIRIPILAATTLAGIACGMAIGKASENKIEKNLKME